MLTATAATTETATTEAPAPAPGASAPSRSQRVDFPGLVACGGVFRSKPGADGTIHFDAGLVPRVKITGPDGAEKEVAGLPEWPLPVGPDGQPIPLPWSQHKRSEHVALKREHFEEPRGYQLYRAWEAYQEAKSLLTAYQQVCDGVQKSASTAARKNIAIADTLTALAATLAPEQQAAINMVLALLKGNAA